MAEKVIKFRLFLDRISVKAKNNVDTKQFNTKNAKNSGIWPGNKN